MTDDATEIGNLYRRARGEAQAFTCEVTDKADVTEKGTVTRIRHFSGKMSGSRNANRPRDKHPEGTMGWLWDQPQSGDVCCYCREKFEAGQLRYRIMQATPAFGGGRRFFAWIASRQSRMSVVLAATT